jgi:hypothetical protein
MDFLVFKKQKKNKTNVKISIPAVLYETLKESAGLNRMNVSEYLSYLVYKENYYHLSSHSLQVDKPLEKYYQRYCKEKEEKDLWANIFNLEG